MICPRCGKEAEGKFCSACGAPLEITENPSLLTRLKQDVAKQIEAKRAQQVELKERLAEMDRQGIAYCPKCYSTSLVADKKGFGFGKAAIGFVLAGPIGIAAGGIGSGKVKVTCLKCGHQFMAGKRR